MIDILRYEKGSSSEWLHNWQGGYLDTNGHAQPNKYGVSTADSPTRATGTGTWEITSAAGKAVGAEVLSGDAIYLRNLYGDDGGYLDTNGHAPAPNKYECRPRPARTGPPAPGAGGYAPKRRPRQTSRCARATSSTFSTATTTGTAAFWTRVIPDPKRQVRSVHQPLQRSSRRHRHLEGNYSGLGAGGGDW
jgi:hypothetical protein